MVDTASARARVIAFFLPQFHSIPENDAWWGEGFTEWTNVRRAQPAYEGHEHPRRPADSHYFDLTDPAEIRHQWDQARSHGIDGFCVYLYWFGGKRLLERPLEIIAEMEDGPAYMISWANETWSRRWDGREHHVLMRQDYGPTTAEDVFEAFLPHLRNPRYLRRDGRPMIMVHRTDLIPDPSAYAQTWRRLAAEAGVGDLYLIASETRAGIDPRDWDFDALAEFPPVTRGRLRNAMIRPPRGLHRGFAGRLLSYAKMARDAQGRPATPFTLHRGVIPAWDNTARRGLSATIVAGHSPTGYHSWLRWALAQESAAHPGNGLVFVNAWNEWAEGAYLQPDAAHGDAYLKATRAAVDDEDYDGPGPDANLHRRAPLPGTHLGHSRALVNASLASCLGVARTVLSRRKRAR